MVGWIDGQTDRDLLVGMWMDKHCTDRDCQFSCVLVQYTVISVPDAGSSFSSSTRNDKFAARKLTLLKLLNKLLFFSSKQNLRHLLGFIS